MRLIILLMLLLMCSCATQRQAEKFYEENPDKLAELVEKNKADARQRTDGRASGQPVPKFYPPAIHTQKPVKVSRLIPTPMLVPASGAAFGARYSPCPDCPRTYITRTVYLPDTLQLDSLQRELKIEQLANTAIRQKLQQTEADRDYWREMNRKKRWALIAMAVFAVLYILFKILAARVREPEV